MGQEHLGQSVFTQMRNGTRTGEGSFNQGLKDLFYLADTVNRCKLVKAFPEFFGADLPEFGIYAETITENLKHSRSHESGSLEVQTRPGEQRPDIAESNNQPAPSPQKSLLPPSLSSIQTYNVVLLEDNTLYCKEFGQRIPLTRQSSPDISRFAHEIASRIDLYPMRQCQQQEYTAEA